MAILAVGFVDALAEQAFKAHGGHVQHVSSVPPINLVYLPPRSDVGHIKEQVCIISFPDIDGTPVTLEYERHLDITASKIFLNEPDYPSIIA